MSVMLCLTWDMGNRIWKKEKKNHRKMSPGFGCDWMKKMIQKLRRAVIWENIETTRKKYVKIIIHIFMRLFLNRLKIISLHSCLYLWKLFICVCLFHLKLVILKNVWQYIKCNAGTAFSNIVFVIVIYDRRSK